MLLQTYLFFLIIVVSFSLTGFLSWYAWKHAGVPGVKAYAIMALLECLISLAELISMLSITSEQALFWFKFRFIFNSLLPVFFVVFTIRYNGHGAWLSKRVIALLCLVPLVTQFFVWRNPNNFWLTREVAFIKLGIFWIADVANRVPGPWFTIYSFYCLLLVLGGIVMLLITAWSKRKQYFWQAVILATGAATGLMTTIIPLFNLLPFFKFNIFVPGIGLSAVLYAIAIFCFNFIKKPPDHIEKTHDHLYSSPEKRSFGLFIATFVILISGVSALGYLSYRSYAQDFRARVERELSGVATLKVEALSNWRDERYGDAQSIAQNTAFATLAEKIIVNPNDTTSKVDLQNWLDSVRSSYSYNEVFLMDVEGNLILSSPDGISQPIQHLVVQIPETLKTNQITWVDFHFHDNNQIYLSLLVPIKNKQLPVGVLVMNCDPNEWLYPFLKEWPAPSETSETLLVGQEGNEVLFLNPIRFNRESALNLRFPLTNTNLLAVKGVLGESGIVEGVDYRNSAVIGYVTQVPYSPWFLVAKIDKSEVFAPLTVRLWQTIGFFGFLILASGSSMGLLWRRNRLQDYRNRLQAAEALRESEDKFAKAFLTSPDGVSITRLSDGRIVMTNQAYETMLGYKKDEVIGKSSLDLNIWVDNSEREAIVQELQRTGLVKDFEVQFRTSNGDIRYGSMSAAVIDINNEIHILNITRDITERRKIIQALEESESHYRLIAENTADVISVMDAEKLRFTYVSPSVFKLRGFTPEEVIAQPLSAVLTPESLTKLNEQIGDRIRQFQENGSNPISFIDDADQPCKDGTIVPTEILTTFLLNKEGKLEILGVSRDITIRKQAEKVLLEYSEKLEEKVEERTHELRKASERLIRQERLAALGQLAGSIAHELRNPLGVISNAATYLSMIQPEADSKIKEYINIIQTETETSEKIIADLLDYTRLQVVDRKPVDISEIVINALARTPVPKNIDLVRDLGYGLPKCIVNPIQIEQVVSNLVMNSFQAMPKGGEIRLIAAVNDYPGDSEPKLMLSIEDNGCGISPENLERIFEPLFTTKAKGIGLGLAVSKKLIEGNQGHIIVESIVNEGTTFRVFLPIIKEQK